MENYQAIILGALQGITEFLPVSSSGHLVLGQKLFGVNEPSLAFNIAMHLGTLLAIIVVFYADLKKIIFSLIECLKILIIKKEFKNNPEIKFISLIIIGSIPTAIIGLIIKKYAMSWFSSPAVVGLMLIITGIILWLSKYFKQELDLKDFSDKKAFLIGISQGIAVIPGISRSGITVVLGLMLGIKRELAARFSFLLSIPAILGAAVLEFFETETLLLDQAVIYGTITAFIIGVLALFLLLKIVKQGKFYLFAPYCWLLGLITLFVS